MVHALLASVNKKLAPYETVAQYETDPEFTKLMPDKDGRRHRARRCRTSSATETVGSPYFVGEIRYRADETRSRLAQLGPSVRRGVLARDRAAPLRLTADKEQRCLYRCIVETYIDVR
jgi:hypothetical protein